MSREIVQGFKDIKIDLVIKFGGSIVNDTEKTCALLKIINEATKNGKHILVIPGGGPPDKAIEKIYAKREFTMATAHEACALAQDQIGLILADPNYSEISIACRNIKDVRVAIQNRRTPILLPSQTLMSLDPVEYSWDITSDAIAGWVAWQIGVSKLIVLTDVDGIYAKDVSGNLLEDKLIEKILASEVVKLGHTSIDVCLAEWIKHGYINECVIVNGNYPERLDNILHEKTALSTHIYYSKSQFLAL